VIQKHAASHLHFDLRLELDGVMKSWAVPKGPSIDPGDKRLAMQVEDHPMEYNTFEGIIPKGEYGGGTVMLWDRGTYTADEAGPHDEQEAVLRSEYQGGKLSVRLHGERVRGSWALVRISGGARPTWLLIKHRDGHARRDADLVRTHTTSVFSGRTMSEIAAEGDQVWRSDRGGGSDARQRGGSGTVPVADVIRPMRPQAARTLPPGLAYLPWRGGERMLAYATREACALIGESGRNRSAAFPGLASALSGLAQRSGRSFVLDGEVTGGTADCHLHVLDLLLTGSEILLDRAWRERRRALESLFAHRRVTRVKLAPAADDLESLLAQAGRQGWSGVFARDPAAPYRPGRRTAEWLRLATPARYR